MNVEAVRTALDAAAAALPSVRLSLQMAQALLAAVTRSAGAGVAAFDGDADELEWDDVEGVASQSGRVDAIGGGGFDVAEVAAAAEVEEAVAAQSVAQVGAPRRRAAGRTREASLQGLGCAATADLPADSACYPSNRGHACVCCSI